MPLPRPTAEMGEHPEPTMAVRSWRVTPTRPSAAVPAAESACQDVRIVSMLHMSKAAQRASGTYAVDAVAALDGAGVAVSGGRKEREGEGREDGGTGEHGREVN